MTRNKFTNKLLVFAIAFAMCSVFLPSAAATAHGSFGTFVLQDDDDFRPTLDDQNDNAEDTVICRADFGTQDRINDDSFYLHWGAAADTSLANHDVRITERGGNGPGSLITDSDTTEKNEDVVCQDPVFQWIDANDDEDFTDEDFIYIGWSQLGNDEVTGSQDHATEEEWWLRLTDTDGGDAGSIVFSGATDLVNYGASAAFPAATGDTGFFDADNDGTFDSGDWLYVTTDNDDPDSDFPGLHDVRIVHEDEGFGSRVGVDDGDFVPTLEDTNTGTDQICRIDFGDAGTITDDSFYLGVSDDDNLVNYDIRLTERTGDAPGSLLDDADTSEKLESGNAQLDCQGLNVIAYDVDNDGDFNEGDYAYAGNGNQLERASDTDDNWFVRLTDTENFDAGTLALSGDQDVRAYGGQSADFDLTGDGMAFRYFDADSTTTFTPGDSGYLTTSGNGAPPSMFDIRVVHDQGFGSLVTPGDEDFVPTLMEVDAPNICRINFGQSGSISDDAFYLDTTDSSDVGSFDVRLTQWNDNPAGSLVMDDDTTERNTDDDCQTAAVYFQDVDNDGDLTDADHVFIGFDQDTNGDISGSTDGGDWWVRLTDTSSHDRGTLVRASHDDLITYGGGEQVDSGNFDLGWFDANNDESFNTGDWAYMTSAGISADDTPPLYSIRVSGSFDVAEPQPDEGPSITIDMPEDGAEFDIGADVEISGTAEAGDNDIDEVTVSVGGEDLDVEGTEDWSATLEGIEAGDHTIEATVTDTEGNSDTASVTVTVEEEMPDAPEISITSPSDGTEFDASEEVSIEGTASGDDIEVTVSVAGEDLDVTGTDEWSATWMPSAQDLGSTVITATVTDSADQTATDSVTISLVDAGEDDDDSVDDDTDDSVDDETTDDEVETPGFSALAALIATVGMAALLRRN